MFADWRNAVVMFSMIVCRVFAPLHEIVSDVANVGAVLAALLVYIRFAFLFLCVWKSVCLHCCASALLCSHRCFLHI